MVTHDYYPLPWKFFFVRIYVPIDEIIINIAFNVAEFVVIWSYVRICRLEILCLIVCDVLLALVK